jgi:hypothetical protein
VTLSDDDQSVSSLLREAHDAMYRDEYGVAESLGEEVLARMSSDTEQDLTEEALDLISSSRRLMGQFAHSWITMAELANRARDGESGKPYGLLALSNMIECAIHLGLPRDKIDAVMDLAETEAMGIGADWLKSRFYLQKSRVLRDRHDFGSASEAAVRSLWLQSRSSEWEWLYATHCYRQAMARSMLDMGEIGEAYLQYGDILASATASHWARVCGHIGLSRVELARGRPKEAAGHGRSAVSEAHHMNPLAVTYALEAAYDAYSYAGEEEKSARTVRDLLFYTARCDSARRRYKALVRANDSRLEPEGCAVEMTRLAQRLIESCGFADGGTPSVGSATGG